jgi:fibronectin type 3 domain-containing protein
MKSVLRFFTIPLLLLAFGLSLYGCGGDSSSGGTSSKPAAPTNVTVTPGDGKAIVSWAPAEGATSYNIYYSTTKGVSDGSKADSGKIENATSPYTVTGLTNGVTYYFTVTALNSKGESGASQEQSAIPAPVPGPPADVSVSGGDSQMTITWGAVTDADSYNVYYGTSPGVTKTTGTKVANAVSPKVVSGLQNGTTYYVVVTAVNGAGESVVSAEKSAIPSSSVQPPAAPTGITAVGSDEKATIHFNPMPGATAYNIYYSTTAGVTKTNGIKVANVGPTSTVGNLTNFTTYYFVVTAVGPGGESAESVEKSATPSAVPAAPKGTSVYPGNTQVTVSWSTVTGATSYNVYYSTTPGVTKSNGTKITNATNPKVVTGLTNDIPYYFVVTAVGPGGESSVSSEHSAIPSATPQPPASPNGVTAVSGPGTGQITVTWNLQITSTSYNIYYVSGWTSDTNPSPATILATGTKKTVTAVPYYAAGTQSYVISGLPPGQQYSLVVSAVNTVGESGTTTKNKHAAAGL